MSVGAWYWVIGVVGNRAVCRSWTREGIGNLWFALGEWSFAAIVYSFSSFLLLDGMSDPGIVGVAPRPGACCGFDDRDWTWTLEGGGITDCESKLQKYA